MKNIKPFNESSDAQIIVPKVWLDSLLDKALDVEQAVKKWNYGDNTNDEILHKVVTLAGYAKSTSSILSNNKRV